MLYKNPSTCAVGRKPLPSLALYSKGLRGKGPGEQPRMWSFFVGFGDNQPILFYKMGVAIVQTSGVIGGLMLEPV